MSLKWYDYLTMSAPERANYRFNEEMQTNLKTLIEMNIAQLERDDFGDGISVGHAAPREAGTIVKKLQESAQILGNPWWADAIGLYPDEAWGRGFPNSGAVYGTDAATISRDDNLRKQNLFMCRRLYDSQPHGRGAINNAMFFVCGSSGWSIDPTPYKPDPRPDVEPVYESDKKRATKVLRMQEDVAQVGNRNRVAPIIRAASFGISPKGDYAPAPWSRPVDAILQGDLREKWTNWIRRKVMHPQLGWYQFCRELTMRLYRDGEVFLFKGHDKKSGAFTPRFLEPECFNSPENCVGEDDPRMSGVEVDPEDEQKVVGYWYKPLNKPREIMHKFIDAKKIMHLKYNTDSGMKRGLPLLFTARAMLNHYDKWITQAIKIQRIQGQIAILRQWEAGDQMQLATMIQNQAVITNNIQTPAGNNLNYTATDQLPIVDAPAGMTMTPFAPRGNFGDSDILARRLELAVCAATTQSEAMISADGSNANYSSTRITQFIPLRGFEADQGYIGENFEELYEDWLRAEVAMKRVKRLRDAQYHCTFTPANLPNFEAELNLGLAVQMFATVDVQGQPKFSDQSIYEFLRMDIKIEKERILEQQREVMQQQKNALEAQQQQAMDQAIANPDQAQPNEAPESETSDQETEPAANAA